MDDVLAVRLDPYQIEVLSHRAEQHGRSVEEEAAEIVKQHLKDAGGREYMLEWSRRIRAMAPKGVPQTDSLVLLREDRDR